MATAGGPKCLHYNFDYFLDISRQTAFRRFQHKKFWNVVVHTASSYLLVWSLFFLLSYVLPSFICHFNLILILVLCLIQDIFLGIAACLVLPAIYWHAMYYHTLNFLQVCSLGMLTLLGQTFIGQKWIEGSEPFSGVSKSNSSIFKAIDIYYDAFMAPLQFSVTLLLRLGYRTDLMGRSDIELRMLLDRVKKVP